MNLHTGTDEDMGKKQWFGAQVLVAKIFLP